MGLHGDSEIMPRFGGTYPLSFPDPWTVIVVIGAVRVIACLLVCFFFTLLSVNEEDV